MKNRLIYLHMIVLMVSLFSVNSFCFAEQTEPNLVIKEDAKLPIVKSGEQVTIKIPIENMNDCSAKDITISPVIEDVNNFPFDMENMVSKKEISYIRSYSEKEVEFNWTVSLNAESKIYPIKLNIDYKSFYNKQMHQTATIYVKITNDYEAPFLGVSKIAVDKEQLISGEVNAVEFTIQNTGDLEAKDIEVRLGGFSNDGLTLHQSMDTRHIDNIEGKDKDKISFDILADEDMKSGTYSLDIFFKYKDEFNKEYTKETKVYLPVRGVDDKIIDFSFENLTYPEQIGTEEDFTISFDLKNIGEDDAKNVKVSLDTGENILSKSTTIKKVGTIAPNENAHFEFILFAEEDTESKNYPIKINVEYDLDDENSADEQNKESISQYVGVFVSKVDKAGEPKVIIKDYNFHGEYIKAGDTFPLDIVFYNTNKEKAVYNVKVSITSEGDIFTTMGMSNTFFIDKIDKRSSLQKAIQLKAKIDAEYKTYNITVDIEYEDSSGNKFTAKEMMGIPIIQETKLSIAEVEMPTEIYVGQPAGLSLDFYNVGRAKIRNMMVHIEGDFGIQEGSMYVGNFEPGADNYFDVTVTPNGEGTTTGTIIFEYDDEIGKHHMEPKEFTMEVIAMPEEPEFDPSMEMEQQPSESKYKWVKIGGGIFILAIAVVIILKRRAKKKQEGLNFDE